MSWKEQYGIVKIKNQERVPSPELNVSPPLSPSGLHPFQHIPLSNLTTLLPSCDSPKNFHMLCTAELILVLEQNIINILKNRNIQSRKNYNSAKNRFKISLFFIFFKFYKLDTVDTEKLWFASSSCHRFYLSFFPFCPWFWWFGKKWKFVETSFFGNFL